MSLYSKQWKQIMNVCQRNYMMSRRLQFMFPLFWLIFHSRFSFFFSHSAFHKCPKLWVSTRKAQIIYSVDVCVTYRWKHVLAAHHRKLNLRLSDREQHRSVECQQVGQHHWDTWEQLWQKGDWPHKERGHQEQLVTNPSWDRHSDCP